MCNLLKIISSTHWGADKKTLLTLYRSLIRSKLDYGCIVYGSARRSYLKALDPIVHQALRICLGAFRSSPAESLYAEAGEPPLELRRLRLSLNYFLKLKSNPENPAYDIVLKPTCVEKFESKPQVIPPFGIRILDHLKQANIDPDLISEDPLTTYTPSWRLSKPNINFNLTNLKKGNTPPQAYKQLYLQECSQYSKFEKIFTDGSLQGNKTAAAAVANKGNAVYQIRLPDDCSIFSAELKAIFLALKHVYKSKNSHFLICSDSLSALEALLSYKMFHPLLTDIHDFHSKLLMENKIISFMWVPGHVGISGNEQADLAAKEALNNEISSVPKQFVPPSDVKMKCKLYERRLWQNRWNLQTSNKLYKAKNDLNKHLLSSVQSRREETVLSRLHIGHTHFTHSFIFDGKDQPWCHACDHPSTVKHFLLDCTDLTEIRNKYFQCNSLENLFTNVPTSCIFSFLKEINLFHKI